MDSNEIMWRAVVGYACLVICVILYLLCANISSWRREDSAMSRVCLRYLCFLHLSSGTVVTSLLLKHLGETTSTFQMCRTFNNLYAASAALSRLWMYLIWENQYRTMALLMRSRRNYVICDPVLFSVKLLVLASMVYIPFGVYYTNTIWSKDDGPADENTTCVAETVTWVGNLHMILQFIVNFVFLGLFLRHVCRTLNAARFLEQSLSSKWSSTDIRQTSSRACAKAKRLTVRRTLITFSDTLWLIALYGIMNNIHITKTSYWFSFSIYVDRALAISQEFSNNVVLYFLFDDYWERMVCCKCGDSQKQELRMPMMQGTGTAAVLGSEGSVGTISSVGQHVVGSRVSFLSSEYSDQDGRRENDVAKYVRAMFMIREDTMVSDGFLNSERESSLDETFKINDQKLDDGSIRLPRSHTEPRKSI